MSDDIIVVLAELDTVHLFTIMDALEIDASYESGTDVLIQRIRDHAEDTDLDIEDIRDAIAEAVRTVRIEHEDDVQDLDDSVMEELHPHF